jgi:hypothetical protein
MRRRQCLGQSGSPAATGFGVDEFLIAVGLPAVLYFVMFFVASWIVTGISKNS